MAALTAGACAAGAFGAGGALAGQAAEEEQSLEGLLSGLVSSDAAERAAAVAAAPGFGAGGIAPVSGLLASDDPAAALAAKQALWRICHHAARPGAAEERAAAGSALLDVVEGGGGAAARLGAGARREVLRMLAATAAGEAAIARLGRLLDDPEAAEMALFALERIAEPGADRVLLARLVKDAAVSRASIARALGQRKCLAATGSLLVLAESGDPEERGAALYSLAILGAPRAEAALLHTFAAGEPEAAQNLLAFAEARLAAGDVGSAERAYAALLGSDQPHLRAAAVRGAAAAGGMAALPGLLEALVDQAVAVRAEALAAVAGIEDDVDGELRGALGAAAPPLQAQILRCLVLRRAEDALALVEAGLGSGAREVRLASIDLARGFDQVSLAPLLLERGVSGGDEQERETALLAYLAQARFRVAAGRVDEGRSMFHQVLQLDAPARVAAEALDGVAAAPDSGSLGLVESHADQPELRDRVNRCRLAIVTGVLTDDPARAAEVLERVCLESGPGTVRQNALARLREMGVDTTKFARQRGFAVSWQILGPFPEATEEDLGTHPFGAAGPDPSQDFAGGERTLAWTEKTTDDIDGIVDLRFLQPNEHVSAYAFATFERPAAGPGVLLAGSDDGIAIWLNDELVHANFAWRGAAPDQDRVPVTFRSGTNTLLVKVTQGGGGWEFCVRLAEAEEGGR